MKGLTFKFKIRLSVVVLTVCAALSAFGQTGTKPLLQPIMVYGAPQPQTSATPFVQKTGSSAPAIISGNPVKTSIPILADALIPGVSGVLVETLDGNVVVESGSNQTFNPASNVKIATSYAVMKTFGPEYRFPTNFWTDGTFDQASGTLYGNLYVSGRDPIFGYEHAVSAAQALNRLGIRAINGDLVVTDNFAMNYTTSAVRSSQMLFTSLDASKRSAAASRVWSAYLVNSGRLAQSTGIASVTFTGGVYVQPMPGNLKLLFSHESAPLREIVKATNSYSNNFLADRLGDMLGGPYAVARVVQQNTGSQPGEFYLQTASGLGINRVTPNAMMKLIRAFRTELARYKMTFADVMPVAGIDKGTLENRFDTDFAVGSVVGKTGTLGQTDGGVSSLAGELNTRSGRLLFVIFNQRGNVNRFRSFQNYYVSLIQGQFGGPATLAYAPLSLEARLARNRITFPQGHSAGN